MKKYEIIFILDANKTDEEADEITNKVQNIITGLNGKIENIEKWGRKKLSYTIGKETKGNYIFIKTECDAKTLDELVRNFRLNDNIIRYLVTKIV